MLVATRQLDWTSIILFSLILLLSWQVDAGRLQWKMRPTVVSWLMLIFLPFPFIDWVVLGTSPIVALIHFIFFASAMKLLQQKRNRDWLWLYVVSFFQMLLAAGMMIDTTFFILLLAFLFSAVSTLVSFEMRRAQHDLAAATPQQEVETTEYWRDTPTVRNLLTQPRWRSLAIFSIISLFTISLLATPLFLAMPRLALRNGGAGWMQGASLSGFSETVRLGEVGQLKLNPRLVMRVRVVQPADQYRAQLRWRGVTLDFYDGTGWRDTATLRRGNKTDARPVTKHGSVYWLDEATEINHAAVAPYITRQTFYLEPLSTPTVFAASQPLWVEGLPSLWQDSSDGLWTSNHAMNRITYSVESDARQPTDKELRAHDSREYEATIKLRYLQVPPNLDPRIGQLAAQIIKDQPTALDAARKIENHLHTNYQYSLDLRRTDNGDPVADFLFNVRAGHCEYFATAMVLLLRTQGIPARLVNGFQMGEFSDISDFYTVRQSDAHSWVEVYFPNSGWVAFDPTPSAGLSQYENGWLATMRHYTEAAEMFWLENVIGFSSNDQAAMAFRAQHLFSDYQKGLSDWWAKWKTRLGDQLQAWRGNTAIENHNVGDRIRNILLHPALLFLYFVGFLIGGFVFWRKHSFSWRRRFQQDAVGSAIGFYQEMLSSLKRLGYERAANQTPQEFAQAIPLPHVTEITQLYQHVRFGGATLSAAEIQQIETHLKELREIKPASRLGA